MVVTTITIHLGFSVRRVYTRDSLFSAGREEGVLLKDRDRERFSIGTTKDSLGGKVKEKGVVVVELIQCSALVSCDKTKSEEEGKRIESLQCDQSYWYIYIHCTCTCTLIPQNCYPYLLSLDVCMTKLMAGTG